MALNTFLSAASLVISRCKAETSQSAPNIIMFLVDDLGFTDTGYYSNYEAGANNFAFSTPVLESMASAGVRLNYHYSESVCAATRSALLSGRYAWRTGSDYMISPGSTIHTDTNMKLMPEILRDVYDYRTLMLGKWNLGYAHLSHLPFSRGFDDCLFFTNGGLDYIDHTSCSTWDYFDDETDGLSADFVAERDALLGEKNLCQHDLWNCDYEPVHSEGVYDERLFTNKVLEFIHAQAQDPSQPFFVYYAMPTPHTGLTEPPVTGYAECSHIDDASRQTYCHMVRYAESLIAEIVAELNTHGLMDNTVIAFLSDNGGSTGNGRGQNLPLRGRKSSKFEGGIRTAAFLYGGFIDQYISAPCEYDDLFYIDDWYTSLMQMASRNTLRNAELDGIIGDAIPVDGVAQWSRILEQCSGAAHEDAGNVRSTVVSARLCDDDYFIKTYVRRGDWKLIVNNSQSECGVAGSPAGGASDFWATFDGITQRTPMDREDAYVQFLESGEERFRSQCFDAIIDAGGENSEEHFQYEELMLFNVASDPIEACNVAEQETQVVAELMKLLEAEVMGAYSGSGKSVPVASATLKQAETYSCARDAVYLISWADDACCDDPGFDDWHSAWQALMDVKEQCTAGGDECVPDPLCEPECGRQFEPVCCAGVTFDNPCSANCECAQECVTGRCSNSSQLLQLMPRSASDGDSEEALKRNIKSRDDKESAAAVSASFFALHKDELLTVLLLSNLALLAYVACSRGRGHQYATVYMSDAQTGVDEQESEKEEAV